MAKGEQLKALLRSFVGDDDEQFRSIALQMAAHEARLGNVRLAEDIRLLIDESRRRQQTKRFPKAVPIARLTGELASLVNTSYPVTRLSDMVLSNRVRTQLEDVILQDRQRNRLHAHKLTPKRKLLLVGPPGCGKTMTASALAGECQTPLMAVQLHSIITKFMGETAVKLHQIFNAMTETRGVYLFDEFDAIGAHRASVNDVGEMRRVLNSFLLFIEQDESESIIVAATNFVEMLDEALFRRFDDVIRYERPDPGAARALIENRLSSFTLVGVRWTGVASAAKGLSHAEIAKACDDAARVAVLSDTQEIRAEQIVLALKSRAGMAVPKRG